jgi:hypothetical protein
MDISDHGLDRPGSREGPRPGGPGDAEWQAEFEQYIETRQGRRTLSNIGRTREGMRQFFRDSSLQPLKFTSLAGSILDLAGRHPVAFNPDIRPPVFNLFEQSDLPGFAELRREALTVLTMGVLGLAFGTGGDFAPDILLTTAFGADAPADMLRGRITDRSDDAPGIPDGLGRISQAELDDLVAWGTLRDLLEAFRAHGRDFSANAAWAGRARAHANGITAIDPLRACPGDMVVIRGTGFGESPPANTSVRFPTADGGCVDVQPTPMPGNDGWNDSAISVTVPLFAGAGCVGFLVTDGQAPASGVISHSDLVATAGMYQSVLGDIFGPTGVAFGQVVVDVVARTPTEPALPCPPCLPAGPDGRVPNYFWGGAPIVRTFDIEQVAPSDTVPPRFEIDVVPGAHVILHWAVEGADEIRIDGGADAGLPWGTAPVPLPRIVGPLLASGQAGPFTLRNGSEFGWSGTYTLVASNRCGATSSHSLRINMRERPVLFGLADTHTHFMAQYAHAGYGIWGRAFPEDSTLTGNAALAASVNHCDGPGGHGAGGRLPTFDGIGHLVGGNPEFDGWPTHSGLAHQQAYIDWIKRAVDGGLRLAVCLAVNSEIWARTQQALRFGSRPADDRLTRAAGGYPSDDMGQVALQLKAMKAMVDYVDAISGGPGQGWVQLALTPADARSIIAQNKLALVPGVEVASLGGWATPRELENAALDAGKSTRTLIAEMVEDLFAQGVRHVFPLHGVNNAFGGTGLFVVNYDAANLFKTKRFFEVETADPSDGIAYRLDQDEFDGGVIAQFIGYDFSIPVHTWGQTPGGHINAEPMSVHGQVLIDELMKRGMLIDIDHMGKKTMDTTLKRCEAVGYPVVSGHTQFRELKFGWRPDLPARARALGITMTDDDARQATYNSSDANSRLLFGTSNGRRLACEVDKHPADIARIRALGGFISPILIQQEPGPCRCFQVPPVPANSTGSSRSFAQALLYAYERMGGRRVGFGSDINGAAPLPGPRFGPNASAFLKDDKDRKVRAEELLYPNITHRPSRRDETLAQERGVLYAGSVQEYRDTRFLNWGPPEYPFTSRERDFWESICIVASGTVPETAYQPNLRTPVQKNSIVNYALGLSTSSLAALPVQPAMIWFSANMDEQHAAYLARRPAEITGAESQAVLDLLAVFRPIWEHWERAEQSANSAVQFAVEHFGPGPGKPGLYDSQGRLIRSIGGRRDWDLNLDGMAHYGLLPDLMQDLRNIGVTAEVMNMLYRSAEDYIRTWERCWALRGVTAALSPLRARPGSRVTALAKDVGDIALLATDQGGDVVTAERNAGGIWAGWTLANTGPWPWGAEAGSVTQGFVGLGPTSVVTNWNGGVQLFTVNSTGQLQACEFIPRSEWVVVPSGGFPPGASVAAIPAGSAIQLFVVDAAGTVMTAYQYQPTARLAGGWTGWSALGSLVCTPGVAPLALNAPDGSVHLLAIAADGRMMWNNRGAPAPTANWTGWVVVDSGSARLFPQSPVAGAVLPNGLEVLVIDTGRRVLRLTYSFTGGSWSSASDTGGRLPSGAKLEVVAFNGVLAAFGVDSNGVLLASELSAVQTPSQWWELMARLEPLAAVSALPAASGIELFVVDRAGGVWSGLWRHDTDMDDWQTLSS